MKRFLFALIIIVLTLSSCYKGHYIADSSRDIVLYSSVDKSAPVAEIIPAGSKILFTKARRGYYKVTCESYSGYAFKLSIINKFKQPKTPETELVKSTFYNRSQTDTRTSNSKSNYGTYTPSSDGRVNVRGYYRKNGTYVRPHTRRSPSRRR